MAAQAQTNRREEISFPPNTPVTLALKYAQGKPVPSMNGERLMLTTTDNRVAFVDIAVAGQIERAGINVREPFTITQNWDGVKGSPRTWSVARLAATPASVGEQSDGTFAVPKLPPASADRATSDAPAERKPPAMARTLLVEDCCNMVDAYAAVLEHALTTHNGRVKPDEVKSIFLTVAINRRQSSVA